MDSQMDSQWIEKERRQHTRFNFCNRLFFQVTAPTDSWPFPNGGTVQEKERPSALIKNVGGRGCCLTMDRPLRKFQIIKVDFPLPQLSLSIPTLAEIRWVHLIPEINKYIVGVRYLL